MLSNLTPKKSVENIRVQSKHDLKLVRGLKPLQKHKFYLDVKNHVTSTKIEDKIKNLGGTVEVFLIQEVSLVVSDRADSWTRRSSSTPQTPVTVYSNESVPSALESPATPRTSSVAVGNKRLKTRADAMLERARLLSSHNSIDPLDNTKRWGIPIWSVEKILNWLEKVSASIVLRGEELSVIKGKSVIKTAKVHNLKPPFIKFETFSRNTRPVYQQIPIWPTINLNCSIGVPPFCEPTAELVKVKSVSDRHRMMRKTRTRLALRSEDNKVQSGYCEICQIEYSDLAKHVRTETHLNFVQNDTNFLSLDSFISASANVEAFLRLNGTSKDISPPPVFGRRSLRRSNDSKCTTKHISYKNEIEVKCNGECTSPPPVQKRSEQSIGYNKSSRMTRSSSACEKTTREAPAPISPALSDNGHHLRSRGQLWLPNNLLGTTAEDEGNPVKPGPKESAKHDRDCKYEKHKSEIKNEDDSDDEKPLINHISNNTKLTVNTKLIANNELKKSSQRLSTSERNSQARRGRGRKKIHKLPLPNKDFYKVEVLGSKLRSSGVSSHRDHSNSVNASEVNENAGHEKSDRLVVKFHRVRRSELSVLNDEAENFMFPRRDESSSGDDSCDTDEERNTTRSSIKNDSIDIKSSDNEYHHNRREVCYDESSQTGFSSCESDSVTSRKPGRKKRRRTHAEAFIADNEKYYKFETPGSRLRFQGSFMPLMAGNCGIDKGDDKEIKQEPEESVELPPIDQLTFSFERLVKTDPLEFCLERASYRCFSDSGFTKPFLMPYEMDWLPPPLDPQMCKEAFDKRLKSYDLDDNDDSFCHSETSDSQSYETPTHVRIAHPVSTRGRRGRRKGFKLSASSSRNPRKSPRQHASTLAILSLLQQRKRKSKTPDTSEIDVLPTIAEETVNNVVVATPREVQPLIKNQPVEDVVHIANTIDEILDQESIASDEFLDVSNDIDCFDSSLDVISLLSTYKECTTMEDVALDGSKVCFRRKRKFGLPGKLIFRREIKRKSKRKNNRTGWPKKKRVFLKKDAEKIDEPIEKSHQDNFDNVNVCTGVNDNKCSENNGKEDVKQTKTDDSDSGVVVNSVNTLVDVNMKEHNHLEQSIIQNGINNEVQIEQKCRIRENGIDDGITNSAENKFESIDSPATRISSRNPSSEGMGSSGNHHSSNSVNVDLDKWENAEKMLGEKFAASKNSDDQDSCSENISSRRSSVDVHEIQRASIEFQPVVRVQKLENLSLNVSRLTKRRLRSSSSPVCSSELKLKRARQNSPPILPRKLRKQRGRWYRDR